jgi:hypothetical protein
MLEAARGRGLPTVIIRPIFIWILLAAIILFWILRNISALAMLSSGQLAASSQFQGCRGDTRLDQVIGSDLRPASSWGW